MTMIRASHFLASELCDTLLIMKAALPLLDGSAPLAFALPIAIKGRQL